MKTTLLNPEDSIIKNEDSKTVTIDEVTSRPLTLINALDDLAKMAKGSKLSEDFLQDAEELTGYIGAKLHTTPIESAILAVLIDCGCTVNDDSYISDVKSALGLTGVRSLQLDPHIHSLKVKHILVPYNGIRPGVIIHQDLTEAILTDSEYTPKKVKCLDTEELLIEFEEIVSELFTNNETSDRKYYLALINQLIENNKDLPFIRKVTSYGLVDKDRVLLIQFCSMLYNDGIEQIEAKHVWAFFDRKMLHKRFWDAMTHRCHIFFSLQLIENHCCNGFADTGSFQLTEKAKTELLADVQQKTLSKNMSGENVTLASDIVYKEMFYNDGEKAQIDRLSSLLYDDNYKNIQARLRENGMRPGFPVLFYGSPGTGKTETVLQIARATGRDILMVDIAQIRDKWVGETEKNIKRVFDSYKAIAKRRKLTPILLFNEADALINKRTSDADHSVDKMENAMQNIILQEMETLEGILIATTNLTSNMDPAFERRFLYKIEFSKPSLEARKSIWKSMMPQLDDADVTKLASKYNFSGGQIENIARKRAIESIITGKEPSITEMEQFCESESINDSTTVSRKRIGF